MAINVEVTRNNNENSLGILRRFSRKVQSAGIIPRMRSLRFSSRVQSPYKVKQRTLKNLSKRAHTAELIKLGKAPLKNSKKK